MSGNCHQEKEIGEHGANIKTLQIDVEKLEKKSDNRKDETVELRSDLQHESNTRRLDQEKVLHAVEESNVAISGLTATIEQIAEDQKDMKNDIHELKNNSFNVGKFLAGCVSPKGLIAIVTICTTISVVSLSIFAPDSLPDFLKSVSKIKVK